MNRVMPKIPHLYYPFSEKTELFQINNLLDDWENHLRGLSGGGSMQPFNGIFRDGFYPHYYSQKIRILFIGKETLELDDSNYLETLAHSYRITKEVGGRHLNASLFHSRMLNIAYGLLNDCMEWDQIPWASEIGDSFATPDGISFAFMNLSNVSNKSKHRPSGWRVSGKSSGASSRRRDFEKEKVELLKPDLIISMNIMDDLRMILGDVTEIHATGDAEGYLVKIAGHQTILINTWHFAAFGKKHLPHYYSPICEILSIRDQWCVAKQGGTEVPL